VGELGSREYATSRKVAGSIPDEVIGFLNWPNPSSRTMALGSTQPLTEMSTSRLPGDKGRLARKADNLTVIRKLIVYKIWEESQSLTTWCSSTACYRDSFTFLYSVMSYGIYRGMAEWLKFRKEEFVDHFKISQDSRGLIEEN
jgi:hypothetical protein